MARGQNNDREKPQLKVIGDEAEVTRLDPGLETAKPDSSKERAPLVRRAPMRRSDDQLASVASVPVAEISPEPSQPAKPESPETAAVAPMRVPPALIVIVAGAFFLLLGLGVFLAMGGRAGLAKREERSLQHKVEENQKRVQEEKAAARAFLAEVNRALEGYCSATTVEEKLRFARHPNRVQPLMEQYYQDCEFSPRTGATLVEQVQLPMESRSFTIFNVTFDDGSSGLFLAEIDNDLGVRIDWESDVCYQEIPVKELIKRQPTELTDVRVFASPDHHYAYEFSDSGKYQCLKLAFRNSDEYLFGYAERGGEAERALHQVFASTRSRSEPMLLSVRYPEGGHSDRAVIIERFICPRWAYTENPQDE